LNTVAESLEHEYPDSNKGRRTGMSTVKDWIVDRESRTSLYVLGAAGLLVLVACSNVASLMVTRSTARQQELGIRMALGASRTRLLRQLTIESLVLAVIGGGFGILIAAGAVRWLAAVVPDQLPRSTSLSMNWPVTMFGLALTIAVGLLFGLAPTWLVRRRGIQRALHESGRGATASGSRIRLGLIGTQIAMATMLVVGALLLIQSFVRLQRVDLGFQPDHLLTARIRLPQPKYDSNEKAAVFFRTLIEEIRNMPGIVSAGITSAVPLGNPNTSMRIVPVERPSCVPEKGIQGLWRMATADYLATLKVPLRRGRLFNSGDAGRHAIVLSESLAGKKLWPDGSDPLERAVRLGNGQV
jgi:predicted permease